LWIDKCLTSLINQTYKKYTIIFIDDASTDNTGDIVSSIIKKHHNISIRYMRNDVRLYPALSRYRGIEVCEDDVICVFLDGDDWLVHTRVLESVKRAYETTKCLMTLGSFTQKHPEQVQQYANGTANWQYMRRTRWYSRASISTSFFPHLRTVHARVCKSIPRRYMLDHNGDGVKVATDICLFTACYERAGPYAITFIDEPLVVYNMYNTIHRNTGYYNKPNKGEQNYHNEYKQKLWAYQQSLFVLRPFSDTEHASIAKSFLRVYDGPHIYWINLDSSECRHEYMVNMFSMYGIPPHKHERVQAVDGGSNLLMTPYNMAISRGEYALCLSTIRVFNAFICDKQQGDWCIVMEDDVSLELMPYWPSGGVMSVINNAPSDAECIQLTVTAYSKTFNYITTSTTDYVPYQKTFYGTCAYAISRKGAEHVLQLVCQYPHLLYAAPIDHTLYEQCKTYTYKYPLATERGYGNNTTITDRSTRTLHQIEDQHLTVRQQTINWVCSSWKHRQILSWFSPSKH